MSYVETIPLCQLAFCRVIVRQRTEYMSHNENKGGGSEGYMCLRKRNGGKVKPDMAYCAFPSNQFLGPFSTIMSSPLLLL